MLNPRQFDERTGPSPSRRLVRASFVLAATTDAVTRVPRFPRELCALVATYAADWCIASAGDRFVKLWHVPLEHLHAVTKPKGWGTPFTTLTGWYGGRKQDVNAMCTLPGTHRVLTCSDDIKVWDALESKCVQNLVAPSSVVSATKTMWSVAPFRDGTPMFVSAGWDSTLRVWNHATGKVVSELPGHEQPVRVVATLDPMPAGAHLSLAQHAAAAECRYFVSAGDDASIRIWDRSKLPADARSSAVPRLTNQLPALWLGLNKEDEHSARMADDHARAASAHVHTLVGATKPILCLVVQQPYGSSSSSNGTAATGAGAGASSSTCVRFITGDASGAIKFWVWDMANPSPAVPAPAAAAASGDGKGAANDDGVVYGDGGDGTVESRDGSKGYVVDEDGYAMGIAADHDDDVDVPRAAARAAPKEVKPIRDDSRQTIRAHASSVRCLALMPDGRHLVSGGADSLIKVWDLFQTDTTTGAPVCVGLLDGHDNAVCSLAVLPERHTLLVSGGSDRQLVLWDIAHFVNPTAANSSGAAAAAAAAAHAPGGKPIPNHLEYQRDRSRTRGPRETHTNKIIGRLASFPNAHEESVSALVVLDDAHFAFAEDEKQYAHVLPPPEQYNRPWTSAAAHTPAGAAGGSAAH